MDAGNAGLGSHCSVEMDESECELLSERCKLQTTLSKSKNSLKKKPAWSETNIYKSTTAGGGVGGLLFYNTLTLFFNYPYPVNF